MQMSPMFLMLIREIRLFAQFALKNYPGFFACTAAKNKNAKALDFAPSRFRERQIYSVNSGKTYLSNMARLI